MDHQLETELIPELKNAVDPGLFRDSDFLVRSKIFKRDFLLGPGPV